MTSKVFRYSFFVGLLCLLLCASLFFGLQYRRNLDEAAAALRQETLYMAQGIEMNGKAYLQGLPTNKRITWMDARGQIIFDSQPSALQDQSAYEEVRSAMSSGSGQAIRNSDSQGVTNMYYAKKLGDGSIVRLSMPVSAVRSALIMVSPILWVFVLVLTISGVLAFRAAKQIVEPINTLDLDHPEAIRTYPELSPLVGRIRDQSLTIGDQIEELHKRQKEFSALVSNMQEGFLLLDREGKVLTVNDTAAELIPGTSQGDDLLQAKNGQIQSAAASALQGERSESVFSTRRGSWQLIASPVTSRKQIVGAVMLFMDITEREQRERLRREFSANVSHELKTPLTSISGFAELMAQGGVPAEKVQEFSADIYREAMRLIALVDDIIKLSKLDENNALPEMEPVDLYEVAEEVLDSLRSVADRHQVRLELRGSPLQINGIWQLLSEMVYNLCDNAIKYNREGGSVTVTVDRENGCPELVVADTGIGIPHADQSRVFERFYRVDKSHSKQIGGTGLGLSIVKHGAQYHGAEVSLESEPGRGTTIRLRFPKSSGIS